MYIKIVNIIILQHPLEETVLKLIASKHIAPDIVHTTSYKSLLELSLISTCLSNNASSSDSLNSENVVKDLLNARLTAEAGSFSLTSKGTPSGLRSFSAAVQWAKKLYRDTEEE